MASIPPHGLEPFGARPRAWPLTLMCLGVVTLAGWILTRSWHSSLLDHFEFRQLQTAISIWWLQRDGLRLDYLTPLFGPPWSIPFEFPLYQWIVAALVRVTGLALEPTGRLVSLSFFAATLPAVYGLTGLVGLSRSRRLLVLAVILATPVYLFYPRTVMIETTALCFAVWFLYALYRALSGGSLAWSAAAAGFAILAALVKITTFIVYCPPAALLTVAILWQTSVHGRAFHPAVTLRLVLMAGLPVALALVAALWWFARADAIKETNPLTQYLASSALRGWNYGPWGLRFEPAFWVQLWHNITHYVVAEGALALTAVAATLASPHARRIALACLAGFFTGPLIFANLYHVHDYYYCANALLLSGAAGVLLASAWENQRLRASSCWALALLFLVLQYHAFDRGYRQYYASQTPIPELASILRETVAADDVVLIAGADWIPLLPYYAERRAIMLTEGRNHDTDKLNALLAQLPPRRVAAMAVVGEWRQYKDWIRERAAYLGLMPRPFASTADTDLYLPLGAIKSALSHFGDRTYDNVQVRFTDKNLAMPASREQQLPAKDFGMCAPAPHRSRSQFGITVGTIESQPVIFTHAPSELYFSPPPGTHRLAATFGLIPASYAQPPPKATDGVTVQIFEELPGGLRHSLLRRELNPVMREDDRGPQEINLACDTAFTGELVFVISPGDAGNTAYDQAYWSRIEIR